MQTLSSDSYFLLTVSVFTDQVFFFKEAESLNRPITADEIEAVIKKFPTHKSLGPDSFTGQFYKTFKEELTPVLHKLFQKIPED